MIVDASALLAIIFNEPDWLTYAEPLAAAGEKYISPVNWLEVQMRLLRLGDPSLQQVGDRLLAASDVQIVSINVEQAHLAREAWLNFGKGRHPAKLNMGDCFAYALAKQRGEPLLFKGNDFSQTDLVSALSA